MGRIAFWLCLIALIYFAIVFARRRRVQDVRRAKQRQQSAAADKVLPMVQCPVCGTHFPADEAVMGEGVRYCSEKCRAKARAKMV